MVMSQGSPVEASHTRMLPSAELVATCSASAVKLAAVISAVWPCERSCYQHMARCQMGTYAAVSGCQAAGSAVHRP